MIAAEADKVKNKKKRKRKGTKTHTKKPKTSPIDDSSEVIVNLLKTINDIERKLKQVKRAIEKL